MPAHEPTIAFVLLAAAFGLWLVYAFHLRVNSDEPQHLHVVWGWTHGMLQYRDFFDNHTPLFYIICTPILTALGERANIVVLMRFAMLPLFGLALWLTYMIGCAAFGRRVGLWAAALTGLFPGFFVGAVEFRPDNLWTVLYLLALAVLVRGRLTAARSFVVGLLLGAALCTSIKTVALLASLTIAALGTFALAPVPHSRVRLRQLLFSAAATFAGLVSVVLTLTLFFAVHGALASFVYGTITHNLLFSSLRSIHPARPLLFPATLPLLWWGARALVNRAPDAGTAARQTLILLSAGVYLSALFSFDPWMWSENFLPFYPLFAVLMTAAMLAAADRAGDRSPRALVPALAAILEIIVLLTVWPLQDHRVREEEALLTDVLLLTTPQEFVMDSKGETVFRPRPFYYTLETITRERMRLGLIADTIPERLIATDTCVVADIGAFPPRARAFVQANYLPFGRVWVAGQMLPAADTGTISFDVQIRAQYTLVAERGFVAGWLDGTPYNGPRRLEVGHHEFRYSSDRCRLALVHSGINWATYFGWGVPQHGGPTTF